MAGRAGLNEGAQEAPQRMVEFNDKKIDLSKYSPIETPAQLNAYSKESRVWGQVVKDMKSIKKDLDKMEKMTEKNIFAPYGSVFKELPNIGKDYVSRLAGPETENEKLQDINKEVTLRGDLISKFTSLEPILERASKGGVPDAQMLARFKDLRVYLSKDEPIDRLQYRLKRLLEDAEDRELSSKASLKFKHEIDSLKGGEGKEAAEEAIDMDSLINNLRSRSPTFAKMSDEEARKWIEQGNYDKTHQLMRISEGSAK
jgi:hypothetical protein